MSARVNVTILPPGDSGNFDACTIHDGIKQLKRVGLRSGLLKEMKRRAEYMPPGERLRRKQKEARRRQRKYDRKQTSFEDARDSYRFDKPWLNPRPKKRPFLNLKAPAPVQPNDQDTAGA